MAQFTQFLALCALSSPPAPKLSDTLKGLEEGILIQNIASGQETVLRLIYYDFFSSVWKPARQQMNSRFPSTKKNVL